MVGNVFFVIMPGQRAMVDAASKGEPVDPAHGLRAKQRSVHNTFFTLPVLFVMISNHYAMTYGHAWNWLILIAITLAGGLIRIYFVQRHFSSHDTIHKDMKKASPIPIIAAILILLFVSLVLTAPEPISTDLSDSDADTHGLPQQNTNIHWFLKSASRLHDGYT